MVEGTDAKVDRSWQVEHSAVQGGATEVVASGKVTTSEAAVQRALLWLSPGTTVTPSATLVRHVSRQEANDITGSAPQYAVIGQDPQEPVWVVAIQSSSSVINPFSGSEPAETYTGGIVSISDRGQPVNFVYLGADAASSSMWQRVEQMPNSIAGN
jgi:hypothetical protein